MCIMERTVEINTTLSIINTIIKAKVVHQLSMLLLTEQCCHQSNEVRVLAREEKPKVSTRKHELTTYLCMAYYWLGMGKRDHITQVTAILQI